jgi:hypothetical protein
MTLGEKQRQHPLMLAKLIIWLYEQGYEVTWGDSYRDPRLHGAQGIKLGYGAMNSNHKIRLAVDLNLFKDGKFLTSTEDHTPIGEKWESMGGAWGGRFSDGNHYSLEHEGRK